MVSNGSAHKAWRQFWDGGRVRRFISKRFRWGKALGLLVALTGVYAFVAPADWVKPQWFWAKPRPHILTADVARRWPFVGSGGTFEDSALIRIGGDQMTPSMREMGKHLIVYWRLLDPNPSPWRVGRETGLKSQPATQPIAALTAGPWEMDITVSCPATFRGVIELRPDLVSAKTFSMVSVNKQGSATATRSELPPGGWSGNGYLVETTGITAGELPSPYRQIGQLSANVSIDRFRAILGPEVTWTRIPLGKEFQFINQDYFVEAFTDTDGRVVMYTVTTLANSFRPTFRYFCANSWHQIKLGLTRFSQDGTTPSQCDAYFYATRYLYYETYRLRESGYYQTMFLANDYVGRPYISSAVMPRALFSAFGPLRHIDAGQLARFRGTRPSTRSVFAPLTALGCQSRPAWPVLIGPTVQDLLPLDGNGVSSPTQ